MMRILICFFLLWLSLHACKEKAVAERRIAPATMEKLLWDMIRADVYTHDFLKKDSMVNDTLINAGLQKKIFKTYKVSREDFLESYRYYMEHPAEMQAILDSIRSHHSAEQPALLKTKPISIIP